MATVAAHPMQGFPVRPLKFTIDELSEEDFLWSPHRPELAVFLNALGVHVPYFERYLVHSMRQARERITDPELRQDATAIIGQEAHHAHNFLKLNARLAERYPRMPEFEATNKHYFEGAAGRDSLKRLTGFTAGYETFTFLAGAIILQNHPRWLADAQPVMNALWVWHQVEEVEHGAVAIDVYRHLYGDHEWYRKWMVLVALTHIFRETFAAYFHMVRVEGWLRRPRRALRSVGFFLYLGGVFLKNALPAFRRGYDPRRHPLVTDGQSPIQIAWRHYAAAGGNVLAIDRDKMAEILGVARYGDPADG
ncbi:metal-dependent hydrolase [Algiphilus sp.]|uniref:metal-dependent hydrolase n=1 Tax=Algiphilus sp. TaxID=1872431 RepID=UPI003BADA558